LESSKGAGRKLKDAKSKLLWNDIEVRRSGHNTDEQSTKLGSNKEYLEQVDTF
jgi:hypothetical protein